MKGIVTVLQSPKLWTKDYIMVMISNFSASISYTAFVTILVLYVNQIGGDNRIAGLLAGGMTIIMMISRPIFGRLLDIIGRRPMVYAGGILFALNTIAYNFAKTLPVLSVVRVIHGFSQALYIVSTSTLVADIVPEKRMVEGIGFFSVSSSISTALGPMVGLIIYKAFGAEGLFLFMSIFSSVGAVAAMLIHIKPIERIEPRPEQKPVSNLYSFLRGLIEPSALAPGIIMLFTYLGYSAVQNFLSACGTYRGIDSVSLYFTVSSIAMILVRFATGKLNSCFGFSKLILSSLVLCVLSFALIAFAQTLPALIAAGACYGLGFGVLQPMLQTLVFQMSPLSKRGSANATFGLMQDTGTGLGSMLWGAVTLAAGYTFTYLSAALCVCLGVAFHLAIFRKSLKNFTSVAS